MQRVLGRIVDVRPDERRAAALAFLYFFLILTSYYLLRPVRDEMGIAGGVGAVTWLMMATLVATLVAVQLWSALVARVRRGRLLPWVYHFFALNLIALFGAMHREGWQVWAARIFFVWVSVFAVLGVAVFWSLMADLFDREQAKRLFGFIAAGGSAGAICGPLLTTALVGWLGPVNLLAVSLLLVELAVLCVHALLRWQTGRPHQRGADEPVGGGTWAGLRQVVTSSYLGAIAGYVLLITAISTVGYMLQINVMAASEMAPIERTRLFAIIDLASNALTLTVQTLVTARVLKRLGVAFALGTAPPVHALSLLVFAAMPTVVVSSVLQVLRRAAGFALAGPAGHVLFTPLTPEQKYKAKPVIDAVVYRAGDVVGSLAFTLMGGLGLGLAGRSLAALPLVVLWMGLVVFLGRRHRALTAD